MEALTSREDESTEEVPGGASGASGQLAVDARREPETPELVRYVGSVTN
jgi:hypothetical protein